MGRKRQNRRQNVDFVDSEISLNNGEASSGSESESSIVSGTKSKTVAGEKSSSHVLDGHKEINQGPMAYQSVSIESNSHMNNRDLTHSSQATNPTQTQDHSTTPGSGDDSNVQKSDDLGNLSTMFQSFLKHIDQQNETQRRSLRECLSGVASTVRENSASMSECMISATNMMKECMMGMANLIKENSSQILQGVQDLSGKVEAISTNSGISAEVTREATLGVTTDSYSSAVTSLISTPTFSVVNATTNFPTTTNVSHTNLSLTSQLGSSHQPPSLPHISSIPVSALPVLSTNDTSSRADCNTSSNNKFVKLPAFTGNSKDNWKVWYSRFNTVADLNHWDEKTRLSELIQRLQGTAADFVFDEISSDSIKSYEGLVRELHLRFQSVETCKTYKVQFAKQVQHFGESVEEYAAELKRLYDKAYPCKNREMRQQLLLQQFLTGLRDKQAKFAVEYFKEPNSIEDAVHNGITYMEAQHGQLSEARGYNKHRSKTVQFLDTDNDDNGNDDEDYEGTDFPSLPYSSVKRRKNKQTVRKIKTDTSKGSSNQQNLTESTKADNSEMLQKILTFMEQISSDSVSKKTLTPQSFISTDHSQTPKSNAVQGSTSYTQNQVTGSQGQGQSQNRGQGYNRDQGDFANLQCYYCHELGHIKRRCPILKAEQEQGLPSVQQRSLKSGIPFYNQSQPGRNNIALN